MLENTENILNITKSICLAGFTFFICWAIYYFVMIFKQIFKITKETRERFGKLDQIIKNLSQKIEHSTSYLFLIGQGVKKIANIVHEYSERKKETDKKETDKK
jgi:hypothetical protein